MLDALERLTAQPVPDEAALAGLRYQLTRTSGARRKLVDALCLELRMGLPTDETPPLDALHQANTAAMTASSEHIGTWSLREIVKNWSGYCQASQAMRKGMRAQIEAEKGALYPYL